MPPLRFADELITAQVGALTAVALTMKKPTVLLGTVPAFPFWLSSDDGAGVTVREESRRTAGETIEVTGEAGGEWTIVRAKIGAAAAHEPGTVWTLTINAEQITALYFRSSTVGATRVAFAPGAGTHNNVELPEGEYISVATPLAGITFTGFKGGLLAEGVGRSIVLENAGPGNMLLVPLSGLSEAANEFQFETTETQLLRPFEIAVLLYSPATDKWHNVSIPVLTAATRPVGQEPGEEGVLGILGNARSRVYVIEGNGERTEWEWNPEHGKTAEKDPVLPAVQVAKSIAGGAWEAVTLASINCKIIFPGAAGGAEQHVKAVFSVAPAEGVSYVFTSVG